MLVFNPLSLTKLTVHFICSLNSTTMDQTFVSMWRRVNYILVFSGVPIFSFNSLEHRFTTKLLVVSVFWNLILAFFCLGIVWFSFLSLPSLKDPPSIFEFVLNMVVSLTFNFFLLNTALYNIYSKRSQLFVINLLHQSETVVFSALRTRRHLNVLHFKLFHKIQTAYFIYIFLFAVNIAYMVAQHFNSLSLVFGLMETFIVYQTSSKQLLQLFCTTRLWKSYEYLLKQIHRTDIQKLIKVIDNLNDTYLQVSQKFGTIILIDTVTGLFLQVIFAYLLLFKLDWNLVKSLVLMSPIIFQVFPIYWQWNQVSYIVSIPYIQ